jgi:predicted SAM-dependent methyltransferase
MGKNVKWFSRIELNKEIWKHIKPADIVLDIGCGVRPQAFIVPKVHYCYEPYQEYCEILRQKRKGDEYRVIRNKTAQDAVKDFTSKSVDTIFMLDVLEHINKEDGKKILKKCLSIARNQVIVFSPLGFMKQEYTNGEKDAWGLSGLYWQTHKSAWGVQDFDSKWTILVSKHYTYFDTKGNLFDEPRGVFWAIYNKNDSKITNTSPMIARIGLTDRLIGISVTLLRMFPRPMSRWIIQRGITIWHKIDMMIRS